MEIVWSCMFWPENVDLFVHSGDFTGEHGRYRHPKRAKVQRIYYPISVQGKLSLIIGRYFATFPAASLQYSPVLRTLGPVQVVFQTCDLVARLLRRWQATWDHSYSFFTDWIVLNESIAQFSESKVVWIVLQPAKHHNQLRWLDIFRLSWHFSSPYFPSARSSSFLIVIIATITTRKQQGGFQ